MNMLNSIMKNCQGRIHVENNWSNSRYYALPLIIVLLSSI